jgi:hypothetical protein
MYTSEQGINVFPYTHGDRVEATRVVLNQERAADLKTVLSQQKSKNVPLDPLEVERMERETRMHPQGGMQKVLLGEQLSKQAPFYLKSHKPTILRKIPVESEAYQSVMENARKRFEDQVLQN